MAQQPTLTTERLILRPYELSDAADIQRLAGAREIAATTSAIPHPYEDGMAQEWIRPHQERFDEGTEVHFALVDKVKKTFIGGMGLLGISREHSRAELGYWVAVPYWNQGYCTEAGRAVLAYGFETLKLNRIYAHHFGQNPASGRVMQKLGMKHEGHLRQHFCKWDDFVDFVLYGILQSEWRQKQEEVVGG